MLLALIAIAWLTLIALCWAACAMAQRGDAELAQGGEAESAASARGYAKPSPDSDRRAPATGPGLLIWEDLPELTVADARPTAGGVR
jgi:hypothetical protein